MKMRGCKPCADPRAPLTPCAADPTLAGDGGVLREEAAVGGFDHILNWTLKRGSHEFPGPDGGTCINEAALVAAGYPYKQVHRVETLPACFSRPIGRVALRLNDDTTDEQRLRLLPFVTRLACAGTPEIEAERADYIEAWTTGACTFERGLAVLQGALGIGRQADAIDAGEVTTRFEAARADNGATAMNPLAILMKVRARMRRRQPEFV